MPLACVLAYLAILNTSYRKHGFNRMLVEDILSPTFQTFRTSIARLLLIPLPTLSLFLVGS